VVTLRLQIDIGRPFISAYIDSAGFIRLALSSVY